MLDSAEHSLEDGRSTSESGRVNKRRSVDADRHVGNKIRERRIMLGLTQQELADKIGVTYQQAHKYERGVNRVSAGRLYEIACALGTGVDYFFEDFGKDAAPELNSRQRLSLEIARYFSQIPEESHQDALSSLARALSES